MSDMSQAYHLAALAVRRRFGEQRPADLDLLRGLRAGDVAIWSGTYDQVQDICTCLEVPYTLDPEPEKPHATGTPVAFLNCSRGYPKELIEHLEAFVRRGGWLVSSDWGLKLVQEAFPGTVRWTGGSTGDEVISVEPDLESLWSEVVVLGAEPQWWLESSSYPIEVVAPDKVRIEAASHDLLVRYDAPVVAVSFAWGRGQVFHVISHFWHQRSRTPTARHQGPGIDFLKQGMRLSPEGIAEVLEAAELLPESVDFGTLQSAATATELVAQICVRAFKQRRGTPGAAG